MRQLKQSIVTAQEIDAAVRAHSMHFQPVPSYSLARRFVGACFSLRRFQHIHGAASPGNRLGKFARSRAAHLFISMEQDDHRPCRRPAFGKYPDRGQHHDYPGFHVQDAGPVDTILAKPPGHGSERAFVPHSIQVTQKQNRIGSPAADRNVLLKSRQIAPAGAA